MMENYYFRVQVVVMHCLICMLKYLADVEFILAFIPRDSVGIHN